MNLFIIGNGFDVAHGLRTSYIDFRKFLDDTDWGYLVNLEKPYGFVPESNQEWVEKHLWREFESNLSAINEDEIVDGCMSIEMGLEGGDIGIEDTLNEYWEDQYGYISKLNDYIKTWVEQIEIEKIKKTSKIKRNSNDVFFSFNYTLLLEKLYKIDSNIVGALPYIDVENMEDIDKLSQSCVNLSNADWDSYETSWNFVKHPFLNGSTLENAYESWKTLSDMKFYQLKESEEEINRKFIELYNLKDELTSDVEENNVTIRKAELQSDIKSFISYAVGCIFGRYSLDIESLAYAGGEWDDSKYKKFIPDRDNCIPITDEEYFADDIVGRFVEFIKSVYGNDTIEENLDFIANALDNKGNTSREIIRNYFVKDFYKDHVKTYQKRPIYWLYDSGKQDGFKALVYMHRYNADTTGVVRVDYLHKMQKIYMSEIDRMNDMAENSNNVREVAQAEKRKEKLIKQLKETKEYDEKIAHLALSRISIDLDDGVKINYEKVQTGQDGKKLEILAKI